MKSGEVVVLAGTPEREEPRARIEEAFSRLRGGAVGQAYWQIRATLATAEALSVLSEQEQVAVREARRILEGSPELKVLNLLAEAAGKEEPQWPGA